jgi:hypothetical protein
VIYKKIGIVTALIVLMSMPNILRADMVIGCPLGVEKGKLWVMSRWMTFKYSKKQFEDCLWNRFSRRIWIKKKVAIDAHSLGDIWLTGLYKVVKDKPTWE